MPTSLSDASFVADLEDRAREEPDRPALRVPRAGVMQTWTRADVRNAALRAAGFLRSAGVRADDCVALFAEDSPEWVAAWLGIHFAGAVAVPLDVQFTTRELKTVLAAAHCGILLHSAGTAGSAEAARRETGLRQLVPIARGSALFSGEALPAPVPRAADDLLTLIFTSGTTGDPKGVRLSVRNVSSNVHAIAQLGIVGPQDSVLCVLPLHHAYALTVSILTALAVGATATFCPSLRGPDILAAMHEAGVTVMPGVPRLLEALDRSIAERIAEAPAARRAAFRLLARLSRAVRHATGLNPGRFLFPSVRRMFGPRFRFFASGGARLDPAVAGRLLDLGIGLVEGYGLTETAPVVTFTPPGAPRPGSVGLPLPGVEIRIDRPDAQGVGEVLVRGPNVMLGYENRPEETAEVLKDGWFHTGDLGCLERDGFLRLTGRLKEVIVTASGKNVYPEDVERCYAESPLIAEICVLPVETADGRVTRLQAVVVPALDEFHRRQATSISDMVRLEVIRISQTLPSHMRVTDLKLVSGEFPRTRLGKLRRPEIRQMSEAGAETPVGSAPDAVDEPATPEAERLLKRLRRFSGLERAVCPADHLEIDLGLDSLARVELEVVLEKEFKMVFTPGEAARVNTVRDLLDRLTGGPAVAAAEADWGSLLAETLSPPLSELFPSEGRTFERACVERTRRFGGLLARLLFRAGVRGVENLPAAGPCVLCPTHASFIDAPLLFVSLPRAQVDRLFFLGAREFFKSPLMRWVARVARVITIGSSETVLVSLRRAAEALRGGRAVCVFPEGSISRDGRLQRPHPGAGILACELGAPLVPVLMRGTFDTLSYEHPRLRPVSLGITIGSPIVPARKVAHTNRDYVEIMQAWQDEIVRMRREDDASGGRTAGRSPIVAEGERSPATSDTRRVLQGFA